MSWSGKHKKQEEEAKQTKELQDKKQGPGKTLEALRLEVLLTGSSFCALLCPRYFVCACACFPNCSAY